MLTPESSIKEVMRQCSQQQVIPQPNGWFRWPNVIEAHQVMFEKARKQCQGLPPIEGEEGRGIIIAAGGRTHFTCAYILLKIIRELGSKLPIEIWFLGRNELDDRMKELLAEFDVYFVDAFDVLQRQPCRLLQGWELKPYSCLFSNFKEVLYLDADNIPLVNPDLLFDLPEYRKYGACFWPDFCAWTFTPGQLEVLGLHPRPAMWTNIYPPDKLEHSYGKPIELMCDPPLETGQFIIDKGRHIKELALCNWMCTCHSDFYFRHFHGDKDMFFTAWQLFNREDIKSIGPTLYGIPRFWPTLDTHSIIQYDFQGKELFHHRVKDKWTTIGKNTHSKLIHQRELHYFECLEDLKKKWDSSIRGVKPPKPILWDESEKITNLFKEHAGRYLYKMLPRAASPAAWIGDQREFELLPNGGIEKPSRKEYYWDIQQPSPQCNRVITIYGIDWMPTCYLTCNQEDGIWRGQWINHERAPVEMIPQKPNSWRYLPTGPHRVVVHKGSVAFIIAFSQDFLGHALVLIDSIQRFHPESHIICWTKGELSLPLPPKTTQFLLPVTDTTLSRERANIILHALQSGYEKIIFLGADTELFALIPLDQLDSSDVVLVPHAIKPHPDDGMAPATQDLCRAGIANADVQLVRNTDEAWKAYKWLSTTLEKHCFIDTSIGFVNEQTWISLFPALFERCSYWKTMQCNIATYNFQLYNMRKEAGVWQTDGGPVLLFHYSGFDPKNPNRISKFFNRIVEPQGDIKDFFESYANRVLSKCS